jgi:hypothetical protein
MALYSKKEFADLCKQKTNYLSVQIQRGKVVLDKDEKIDTSNLINSLYLEKIYGRMDFVPTGHEAFAPAPPKAKPKRKADEWDGFDEDEEETAAGGGSEKSLAELLEAKDIKNLTYPDLERIYKFRQGEHLLKRTEREEIEIQKKRGEVIPSDLLPPVILQHNQSFITTFKEVVDQILTDYTQIKQLTVEEVADMRGRMVDAINTGANKATEMTLKAITTIVKDYTDKRGVGQRNA